MRTSKVTTLVLMTLVWWALSPDTTVQSNLSAEASVSQDNGQDGREDDSDNIAVYTLP